jgi:TolA-binding protein
MAWAALRAQEFSTAADAFARALEHAEDDGLVEDASYWHGVALARAGRGADARVALAAFLDAHPRSVHAGNAAAALGWLLYDLGESSAARPYFERAANSDSAAAKESGRRGLRTLEVEDSGE